MADGDELPTIGQAISQWLGVQLPSVSLPQTLKNIDKAIGKFVLAGGENLEARIRGNTQKAKAKGKIDVEGMFRTEEEKRKLENKAAATQAALEEIETNPGADDAQSEIEDDWLNLFARLAEDKSSEELRRLFGKVLAGEIKKPGSFSLRTIQLLATLSKSDADDVSKFLSHAVGGIIVPFIKVEKSGVMDTTRLQMEELGIASHPSQIGGMALTITIDPKNSYLLIASRHGLLIENKTDKQIKFEIAGQVLTSSARELMPMANPPPTDPNLLKELGTNIRGQFRNAGCGEQLDTDLISLSVVITIPIAPERFRYQVLFEVKI